MARFINKVVVVSGAGSVGPGWGNGRAIAVHMVEEGAHVLALDRDLARMDETLALAQKAAVTSGGSIEAMACDVTLSEAIKACVDHTMARWGRIDVLVNNVGGSAAGGPVEMSEAVWDAQIDHNLKSVFLGCKYVLPIMAAQGAGAIVNIASTSGMRWTGAAQVAYAATKAGVISLTKTTALDVAGANIYVNAIACGGVLTPPFETYLGHASEAEKNSLYQMVPSGRLGRPEEYANVAVFLAAQDHYLVGQVVSPNGGFVI